MKGKKVILITGASSGIGESCFEYLLSKGHSVYGTSRYPSKHENILQMDITDIHSIEATAQLVLKNEGKIDVLVNNAGISSVGPVEETSEEISRQVLETNFWGAINVCNAVIPFMREKQNGLIVNISSIAGRLGVPFQAYYSASKHAIEGLTEAMRMEVAAFGIRMTLIEPGDFKTNISENRMIIDQSNQSPYSASYGQAYRVIYNGEQRGEAPIRIAKLLEKIIYKRNLKVRYAVGKRLDLVSLPLKKILPQRMFEWLIQGHYHIRP